MTPDRPVLEGKTIQVKVTSEVINRVAEIIETLEVSKLMARNISSRIFGYLESSSVHAENS